MLKIKKYEFETKSVEMNLKQRNYQKESIVSAEIMIEFFPCVYEDAVISGAIQIVMDASEIHCLDDFNDKTYEGKVGKVLLSINKDGVWEHKTIYDYTLSFKKRKKNKINFSCVGEDFQIKEEATIVSLYTTSTEKMEDVFLMKDFYDVKFEKKIGQSTISKYIVKK